MTASRAQFWLRFVATIVYATSAGLLYDPNSGWTITLSFFFIVMAALNLSSIATWRGK